MLEVDNYFSLVHSGFNKKETDGVVYFTIPSFDIAGGVTAAFTSRIGGVSEGCFASLNFSLKREANLPNFRENFRRAANAVGVAYESLVLDNYAHSDGIHHAGINDRGKGILIESDLPSCDALIINTPEITAVTMHADCVAVFFYNPKNKVAAVAHAGWRGVYSELPYKIASQMIGDFGCSSNSILAAVGPHIRSCCFEVQSDVAVLFKEKFGDETVRRDGEKLFVDMQKAILLQMKKAGITAGNITCADLCTHCHPELFYSHRRDEGKTGAMASFIALK